MPHLRHSTTAVSPSHSGGFRSLRAAACERLRSLAVSVHLLRSATHRRCPFRMKMIRRGGPPSVGGDGIVKYSLLAIPLAIVVACSAFAEDRPSDRAVYQPRLSDMMAITQFRQYKLWYAARNKNWPLADYEAQRMRQTIQDTITLYSRGDQPDYINKTNKATADIETAIKQKDGTAFVRSFAQLTDACNGCHQSLGYGFIVIRVPSGSPYRNQVIAPQQ
jgi:hypothetical protein